MVITVVYVDVLLFTNTLISYCILLTAARLLHLKVKLYRVIPAAFLSSLSALCVYLPYYTGAFSLMVKLIVCALTTLIAFHSRSFKEYLKTICLTVTVSFVYCGFFIAVYELFKPPNMAIINDVVYFEFNPLVMIGLSALIYLILLLIRRVFAKRITNTIVDLQFVCQSREYHCMGKIDTACTATEPFSGDPVIITDKSVFDTDSMENKRVIPYQTLSGGSLLYAVKCEKLLINRKEIDKNVYIGSAQIADSNFQAIINSVILR
ncbi:MAG: sigma-E processing peptidase SpoIIGA [Ruminococcus sp.]|nr:sigma-E processing peptidase SpoIIGA [Ruminococcus sp.]